MHTIAVGKLSRIWNGHTRLTHGHLMTRNEQPPTCRNAAYGDQRLTIKHCLQDCPQWKDSRKKYNIHSDLRVLLEIYNNIITEAFV